MALHQHRNYTIQLLKVYSLVFTDAGLKSVCLSQVGNYRFMQCPRYHNHALAKDLKAIVRVYGCSITPRIYKFKDYKHNLRQTFGYSIMILGLGGEFILS